MEARVSAPSQSAILEAIIEAMNHVPGDDGPSLTVADLREATGWGEGRCRSAIKLMLREGRMELTHIKRTAMDGSARTIPAYRLKEAP